jgi:Lysylphosphatidylglycerol synthase TM region
MQMTEVRRPWHARVPYRLFSFLLSVALLATGVAVVYQRMDWRSIVAVWTNLDPKLVAFAIAVYWLQYPINSYRLYRVIPWITGRPIAEVPPLWFLFKMTCCSGFVAVAAPIGLAGDVAKIAALRVFGTLSLTDAARCALFDRVVGVQWFSLIGLASLPFQAAAGLGPAIVLPQLALFAGLIAAVGVLLVLPRALTLIRGELVGKIARVFEGYHAVLSPERSAIQLFLALLNVLAAWGTLYLLLRAAGLTANVWLVAGFIPLLQLVNGLPFLYLGWGGREIAMATTLGATSGLSINETLAVSVAWGVVIIIMGVLNGVFLIGDWQVSSKKASDGNGEPSGGSAE